MLYLLFRYNSPTSIIKIIDYHLFKPVLIKEFKQHITFIQQFSSGNFILTRLKQVMEGVYLVNNSELIIYESTLSRVIYKKNIKGKITKLQVIDDKIYLILNIPRKPLTLHILDQKLDIINAYEYVTDFQATKNDIITKLGSLYNKFKYLYSDKSLLIEEDQMKFLILHDGRLLLSELKMLHFRTLTGTVTSSQYRKMYSYNKNGEKEYELTENDETINGTGMPIQLKDGRIIKTGSYGVISWILPIRNTLFEGKPYIRLGNL